MFKSHPSSAQSGPQKRGRLGYWRKTVVGKLMGFVMALTAITLAGPSQATEEEHGIRNIVLVHGAFADGSSWQDVIPILQGKGYNVTAVQNPLTSLADDVRATERVLERQKGGVLLVSHSWGGAVITEAGNTQKVKGLVYLSALVPDAGESVADLMEKRNAPMEGLTPDDNGLVWLDDPEVFGHVMAADVLSDRVRVLSATQKPIAANSFLDKIQAAAWTTKPSWYLVTEEDNALATPVQVWLAKHINANTTELKSSHMSMVSHPGFVAEFIASAAEQLSR